MQLSNETEAFQRGQQRWSEKKAPKTHPQKKKIKYMTALFRGGENQSQLQEKSSEYFFFSLMLFPKVFRKPYNPSFHFSLISSLLISPFC